MSHRQIRVTGAPLALSLASVLFVTLLTLVTSASCRGGESRRWLVVQPGYPGSTSDAEPFLRDFSAYLAERAALPGLRGAYHNDGAAALAAFAEERPAFAVVSLGFYLQHRRRLGLRAVLETRPVDRFLVVAPEGAKPAADALAGASVAGSALAEETFLERLAFPGASGASAWKREPAVRTSRALRRLLRGQYTAVALTGREHEALGGVYRGKKLEIVLLSDYYPPAVVALCEGPTPRAAGEVKKAVGSSDGRSGERAKGERAEEPAGKEGSGGEESARDLDRGASTPQDPSGEGVPSKPSVAPRLGAGDPGSRAAPLSGASVGGSPPRPVGGPLEEREREALLRAFRGMPGDSEGKRLLETMGGRGFVELRTEWLKGLEGTYDAYEKK